MNQRIRHIIEEARKLSPEERADLMQQLDAEFGSEGTPEEIAAAWDEEIARRIARAERGEGTYHDFDAVMAELRAKISRREG